MHKVHAEDDNIILKHCLNNDENVNKYIRAYNCETFNIIKTTKGKQSKSLFQQNWKLYVQFYVTPFRGMYTAWVSESALKENQQKKRIYYSIIFLYLLYLP